MNSYEVIERAKDALERVPEADLNERSRKDYKRVAARLISIAAALRQSWSDWDCREVVLALDFARKTTSIATWRTRKNALRSHYRAQLAEELQRLEMAMDMGWLNCNAPTCLLSRELQDLVGAVDCATESLLMVCAECPLNSDSRKPRHSKVQDLHGLPDHPAIALMRRCPKYRLPILVQAVSACRPAEIVSGINLAIIGKFLVISIHGSKVTGHSGQPIRVCRYLVETECDEILLLVEEVRNGLQKVQIASAACYSSALIKAAKREWPDRARSFSPYCLRHLASSDMKASGMEHAEISAALGHCSDRSRGLYGRQGLGRRSAGVAPSFVEATRPVRQTKRMEHPSSEYSLQASHSSPS